jgi:Tfp pilus assembly protein PilN
MATTMTPPSPPPAPTAGPKPGGRGVRFVAVRASLLPDEVISTRRTQLVRKQVLLGLVIVVGLMIAWFGLSWWQTSSSHSDLDDAQHRTVALQNQQHEFAPLVNAQAQASTIRTQLQKLMVGDLSWKSMLTVLRSKAPAGVHLTTVTGKVTTPTSKNGGTVASGVLNQTGKLSIGSLNVTGTARDQRSVAAYADRLATVKGLTAPLISSVSAADHTLTFTVELIITTDAFGGRYAVSPVTSTTGGH